MRHRSIQVLTLLLILLASPFYTCVGQHTYTLIDEDYNALIDRYTAKYPDLAKNTFTASKPYLRSELAQFVGKVMHDSTNLLSKVDKDNLNYLLHDNWDALSHQDTLEKPVSHWYNNFYQKSSAFYSINTSSFQLQINPVAAFGIGRDMYQPDQGANGQGSNAQGSTNQGAMTLTTNTRGVELRGQIDGKVGFYTFLTDNQVILPNYVYQRTISTTSSAPSILPGEGFIKQLPHNGFDFFTANGYIDFNCSKHINVQFGQGKNIIGDGYRSLELSDYAANYLFLKIDTKVWKFDYTNIFAEMVADANGMGGDINVPRKYMALHYLSYKVTPRFTLGLFEAVTFGNTDSIHDRGFDVNYLNPIIFYKAVENGLGAPDKDHIGIDFKWNISQTLDLYGTIFLDEFNLSEIRANTGWWANKQAAQLGLKYYDVARIKNLDMQLEGNVVPPYTYTHFSWEKGRLNNNNNYYANFANYSNYDQPLAHPNGANFYEMIAILRYQPHYRLQLSGKMIYTIIGLDMNGKDYGSNVLINYNDRVLDYGNYITQGAKTYIGYLSLIATYKLFHNMAIDLTLLHRTERSAVSSYNALDNCLSLTFRWNIGKRLNEF